MFNSRIDVRDMWFLYLISCQKWKLGGLLQTHCIYGDAHITPNDTNVETYKVAYYIDDSQNQH